MSGQKRFGYLVAAVVNLILLWIVNNLLEWGWPAFLTDDFDRLLPFVNANFVATIVLNLVWALRDPPWLRHLGQIGVNVVSFVAAVRTWQIFPFDFTDYSVDWEPVARIVIVLSMIGLVIGTIAEFVKLLRARSAAEQEKAEELNPA